ncbi:MAG: phosphonate metabolism protein PhnM [Devosia sp.]|uniref:alpha-D-ribose 1-methylphosphonate 5-triphosphate diphosphatase n=1 Tax=Devosia sp. TaxID=1871048 RepID=UPI002628CA03|nr:alpha-D-ribose 1-methylphosphonate 5-triphosphate diphosphatase [Devosia sp.]MDB5585541.1 phosphonate metabolism protein PhnM [Devosia sp.]
MTHTAETVLTNARIVLADDVITGSIVLRDGKIVEIGDSSATGEDMDGDYIIPGLVELHTDHLENHYAPRPRVRWNPIASVQAHDAQVAASGITTVFDALRVGTDEQADMGSAEMRVLAEAITAGKAANRLRADHFIHLRCEVSAPDCLENFTALQHDPLVRLASLMDHAPNQRQFASFDAYKIYYQGKLKMSDAALAEFSARRTHDSETYAGPHRAAIAAFCRDNGIVLASHDDATLGHVDEAIAQGIDVAEFPTTIEAARASHDAGLAVLMGAPNVVRGSSHSGNVSARTLAEAGILDILSSDYIPFSLIQAAFTLGDSVDSISLPHAVRLVTKHPATAGGLDDRGEIAAGKRADLVRVRLSDGIPIVRTVWREGQRVI